MVEFTGERVIPGHVNADLWSEHIARYAFARRFTDAKRALDAGCGTGYGSAELAQEAAHVTGMDFSAEALAYARANYQLPNVTFTGGSCAALPFADASFDVAVAFEVIEHLREQATFIAECARVTAPDGLFIVSTPNKRYYSESRVATGPNPFHEHEFEPEEFHRTLSAAFPHVILLLQNRVESFAFHPDKTFWPAEARIDGGAGAAQEAHFLIALCTREPLRDYRSFVYVPRAANILREREQHVILLEKQLAQTKEWLKKTENERQDLLDLFRKQKDELEARNRWAAQLNAQLEAAQERVVALQDEFAREQAASGEVAAQYEAKVQELEIDNRVKAEWAIETEARLSAELQAKCEELGECVRLLDASEALVEERTVWAQRADSERAALQSQLNLVRVSRWFRLGRRLGLGPAGL
ncbi:MAG: methyltransferase domain-containing protein [Bryobacteraceae bacterium]